MAHRLSGLDRSASGIWRFRRAVPEDVRSILGKREWKVSFGTKDREQALILFAKEHKRFELAVAYARSKLARYPSATLTKAQEAQAMIAIAGIDPREAPPVRKPGQTFEDFRSELAAWWNYRDLLVMNYLEDHTDYATMQKDYDVGHWHGQGYVAPMLASYDPELVAEIRAQLEDRNPSKATPTLWDALHLYLDTQSHKKPDRSPEKAHKARLQAETAIRVVGGLFSGNETKLADLDRSKVRSGCRAAWPNYGTHNKYINILSAILNNWNTETNSNLFNPFAGLPNSKLEQKHASARVSFNPNQWRAYIELLKQDRIQEVGLIGLIMAFTGCRTEAASGLEVQDVHLRAEVPYIVFKDNDIRTLDKDTRSRAVPIVPELAKALAKYSAPSGLSEAFFPRFGNAKGAQNVSVNLRNRLSKLLGGKVEGLVPYSFRHTLTDKMRASGMRTDHQHYIIGHESPESTKIHEKYGTMMPPKFLSDGLLQALEQPDWGFVA